MRAGDRWAHFGRVPRVELDLVTRGRYSFTFDLMPYQVSGLTGRARRNLAAAGLNLLWRRARPYAWPLYMQVELSSTCMLRCPACPTGSGAITRPNGMFEVVLAPEATI